ncbi:LIPP-like protein [Mya arenaria]|uniref:LIPP-like protein n=1 Tax=Mya arenaria TaxID=6604 RepID=A0ABY7FTM2_MYAAR|nr:LIPP-like protein [Mya arenaria]
MNTYEVHRFRCNLSYWSLSVSEGGIPRRRRPGDLCRHHALAFRDQGAFRACAVSPSTVAFVSFKRGNDSVVSATRTFRRPRVAVNGSEKHRSRYANGSWLLRILQWIVVSIAPPCSRKILPLPKLAGTSQVGASMEVKTFLVVILTVFAVEAKSVPERRAEKRSSICYGDIGCFSTGGAFTSLYRPLSITPQSPQSVNPRFLLFTRQNPATGSHQFLAYTNTAGIQESNFKGSRPTKVVSHGFLENGFADWLMDELLKNGDYNVILLDWGGGSGIPYTQATANTRVVGAVLAKLIEALQTVASARAEDFHLIGHSLGAHICGYAGERTPNLGRISGLDPADPYFQYTDKTVRLDPSDATFVDVMHTNGASILTLGYGMKQPCGHVDYFPNEGLNQPGCDASPVTKLLTEGDIYNGEFAFKTKNSLLWDNFFFPLLIKSGFSQKSRIEGTCYLTCNMIHLRAHDYFTESINSPCQFSGYSCQDYANFKVKHHFIKGYHYQINVAFGSLPSAKIEQGTVTMNLIDIHEGHTYGFMATSPHDVGDISQVTFSWTLDSHWYNPLSWSLLTRHSIHVSSIDVTSGVTNTKYAYITFFY